MQSTFILTNTLLLTSYKFVLADPNFSGLVNAIFVVIFGLICLVFYTIKLTESKKSGIRILGQFLFWILSLPLLFLTGTMASESYKAYSPENKSEFATFLIAFLSLCLAIIIYFVTQINIFRRTRKKKGVEASGNSIGPEDGKANSNEEIKNKIT